MIYARGDRTGTGRQIYQTWRATGREDAMFSIARLGVPRDLSADGGYMMFETFDDQRPEAADVLALPLDQTGKLDGEACLDCCHIAVRGVPTAAVSERPLGRLHLQ